MSEKAKVKYPRGLALDVARDLLRYIRPLCERVVIAGSLRRGKAEVGDVEIVYISRYLDWPDPEDMLGRVIRTNVMDHALSLMLKLGVIKRRLKENGSPTWGPENKLAVHCGSGMPVDLFETDAQAWANYLVCRTGGEQTNTAIASAAKSIGWKWNPYGEGFTRMFGPDAGRVFTVREEKDVFEFVGLDYLEPNKRR